MKDYDFGPRVGIVYQLSNRLSMEGTYYYGLTDISYPKLAEAALKIQQITLGLKYAFKTKEKENTTVSDQQQLGIKAGGGISRITNSWSIETLSTQFVPSEQGGFYYKRTLGEESSLGMELLFSQIEAKEKSEFEVILILDKSFGILHSRNNLFTHISYLSLPVYYGININKLTINGGFQISYAVKGSSLLKSTGELSGQPYSKETKSEHISIDKFDFGPRVGMIYPLNDKLSVEATYYYGFNNIQKNGSPADEFKVQQVTMGIRYTLWNNTSEK